MRKVGKSTLRGENPGETTASKGRKPRSQDFPPKIPHFLRGSRIGCAASYFRRWDKLTLGATNFRYRSAGGRSTPPGPRYTPAADRSAQPGAQSAACQQRIQKKWVLRLCSKGISPWRLPTFSCRKYPKRLLLQKLYPFRHLLFDFLLQLVENWCPKKLPQCNSKSVTQLFDCRNTRLPALAIHNAVDRRLRDS